MADKNISVEHFGCAKPKKGRKASQSSGVIKTWLAGWTAHFLKMLSAWHGGASIALLGTYNKKSSTDIKPESRFIFRSGLKVITWLWGHAIQIHTRLFKIPRIKSNYFLLCNTYFPFMADWDRIQVFFWQADLLLPTCFVAPLAVSCPWGFLPHLYQWKK